MKIKPFILPLSAIGTCILLIIFAISQTKDTSINSTKIDGEKSYSKVSHSSSKSPKNIPTNMVEVPDTYFKSKEEVSELFKKAGLIPKFVVRNFDDAADINSKTLDIGTCDQLDSTDQNISYFSSDDYKLPNGNYGGYYAVKGTTVIVGYSDHKYIGNSNSTKNEEKNLNSESSSSVSFNITGSKTISNKESGAYKVTVLSGDNILLYILNNDKNSTLGNTKFTENMSEKGDDSGFVSNTIVQLDEGNVVDSGNGTLHLEKISDGKIYITGRKMITNSELGSYTITAVAGDNILLSIFNNDGSDTIGNTKFTENMSVEKNTTNFKQQVSVVLDEGNVVDSGNGTVTLERIT